MVLLLVSAFFFFFLCHKPRSVYPLTKNTGTGEELKHCNRFSELVRLGVKRVKSCPKFTEWNVPNNTPNFIDYRESRSVSKEGRKVFLTHGRDTIGDKIRDLYVTICFVCFYRF